MSPAHLAQVVDEPRELQPVLVGVGGADALGGLEGVHDVGHRDVGVALVHQRVQLLQRLQDGRLELVELPPVLVLRGVEGVMADGFLK